MAGIVDPTPLVQKRLSEIDAEFRPRLEAAERQVAEASTRHERRAAKEIWRSVNREHQRARREAQGLLGGPVAWFAAGDKPDRNSN